MKADIHPEFNKIVVTCSCGHTFETFSTLKGPLSLDVCNRCHPHYTGRNKVVDTAGRIDKFKNRYSMGGRKAAQ